MMRVLNEITFSEIINFCNWKSNWVIMRSDPGYNEGAFNIWKLQLLQFTTSLIMSLSENSEITISSDLSSILTIDCLFLTCSDPKWFELGSCKDNVRTSMNIEVFESFLVSIRKEISL